MGKGHHGIAGVGLSADGEATFLLWNTCTFDIGRQTDAPFQINLLPLDQAVALWLRGSGPTPRLQLVPLHRAANPLCSG